MLKIHVAVAGTREHSELARTGCEMPASMMMLPVTSHVVAPHESDVQYKAKAKLQLNDGSKNNHLAIPSSSVVISCYYCTSYVISSWDQHWAHLLVRKPRSKNRIES